ncbi:ATP-binding protein [Cryobacterium sp. PH29-G1]|uniref:ATP-binding protein n=1 Tax=Cryobacterium sp. PH29-G1 TaxID=3046211 RepID=UPI0024B8BF6D|nr:ATP-binding protein [Cryobacterium sp. PH29-G1]MDJ0349246.1 ATP-binding protein [Cryobacterium sp. PH29-G1]
MPDTSLSRPAARGFTTLLAPVLRAVAAAEPNAVVLIDGPSGAGKSTLADAVVAAWPGTHRPTLVRLDDIYPGWQGLDAAIEQVYTRLLAPRRAGLPGQWQRFDWVRGEPAEWNRVDPQHPLVLEGCGALASAHEAVSDVRVWIDADDTLRKRRALDRDGELYRPYWDRWQAQWESYVVRETPSRWATVRLGVDPRPT